MSRAGMKETYEDELGKLRRVAPGVNDPRELQDENLAPLIGHWPIDFGCIALLLDDYPRAHAWFDVARRANLMASLEATAQIEGWPKWVGKRFQEDVDFFDRCTRLRYLLDNAFEALPLCRRRLQHGQDSNVLRDFVGWQAGRLAHELSILESEPPGRGNQAASWSFTASLHWGLLVPAIYIHDAEGVARYKVLNRRLETWHLSLSSDVGEILRRGFGGFAMMRAWAALVDPDPDAFAPALNSWERVLPRSTSQSYLNKCSPQLLASYLLFYDLNGVKPPLPKAGIPSSFDPDRY